MELYLPFRNAPLSVSYFVLCVYCILYDIILLVCTYVPACWYLCLVCVCALFGLLGSEHTYTYVYVIYDLIIYVFVQPACMVNSTVMQKPMRRLQVTHTGKLVIYLLKPFKSKIPQNSWYLYYYYLHVIVLTLNQIMGITALRTLTYVHVTKEEANCHDLQDLLACMIVSGSEI